jgi:uncharacterized membrane protein YcaP (DUF421 family)
MTLLNEIFGQKGDITTLQECARAVLIFCYGLLLVRLSGRRAFGKWSALDIILSIVVGSSLSRAITGSAPLWGTMVAMALLMALHWLLARLAAWRIGLSRVLEGRAVELARDGMLMRWKQIWHAVSDADLNEALRQHGIERVETTRRIMIEPSGKITVMK